MAQFTVVRELDIHLLASERPQIILLDSCLSVCFQHAISKTAAARITKRDTEMLNH